MIPEEIEECRILMQEHEKAEIKPVITEKEVDYYNIREIVFRYMNEMNTSAITVANNSPDSRLR